MGIKGLLPFLKDVQTLTNIKTFKGCTVAVDTYCWLHKGVYGCVEQIVYGKDDGQYVSYCMKYVHLLVSWGLRPILVFDGRNLPAKELTEKERRERRQAYRSKALTFLHEGKQAEARRCLERCIDVTPAMAARVMEAARSEGIDCIVAPYEADAQLAFLNRCGIAQLVISEDSDLLLFGCDRVFFKLDVNGNGVLIEQDSLPKLKVFKNHFTFDKFLAMCVLSGCDYLPSLPGIGLAKACKFVCATRQGEIAKALKRMPMCLNMLSLEVTDEYIADFENACKTFRHQLVFDPLTRKLVPLTEYPPDLDPASLTCAGEYMPDEKALQLALGNISCKDGSRLASYTTDSYGQHNRRQQQQRPHGSWRPSSAALPQQPQHRSIWDSRFHVSTARDSAGVAGPTPPTPAADESSSGSSQGERPLPGTQRSDAPSTVKSVAHRSTHNTRVRQLTLHTADATDQTVKDLLSMYSGSSSTGQDAECGVSDEEPKFGPGSGSRSSRPAAAVGVAGGSTPYLSQALRASFSSPPVTPSREVGRIDDDGPLGSSVCEQPPASSDIDPAQSGSSAGQICSSPLSVCKLVAHEQQQPPQRRVNVFAAPFKKDRFHLDGASPCSAAVAAAAGGLPSHVITKSRYFAGSAASSGDASMAPAQQRRSGCGLLDAMKEVDPVPDDDEAALGCVSQSHAPPLGVGSLSAAAAAPSCHRRHGSPAAELSPEGAAQGAEAAPSAVVPTSLPASVAASSHHARLQCFSWRPSERHGGAATQPDASPPTASTRILEVSRSAPGPLATATAKSARSVTSGSRSRSSTGGSGGHATPAKRPAQTRRQPAAGSLLAYLRPARAESPTGSSCSSIRRLQDTGRSQPASSSSYSLGLYSSCCSSSSSASRAGEGGDGGVDAELSSPGADSSAEAGDASGWQLPARISSPRRCDAARVHGNSGKRKAAGLTEDDDDRPESVGRSSVANQTRAALTELSRDGNQCTPDRTLPLSSQLVKFKYQSRSCPAKMQLSSSAAN